MDLDRFKSVARAVGLLLGLALLAWAAVRAGGGVDWSAITPRLSLFLAVIGLAVIANLFLTSLLTWLVTRSFPLSPPLRLGRMNELIAASALLNYLPLPSPGLLGRAAYLKARHGLAIRHSVAITLIILAIATVVSAVMAWAVTMTPPTRALGTAVVAMTGLAVAAELLGAMKRLRFAHQAWCWPLLRGADLLVYAGRLWVAFFVVGHPITDEQAIIAAAAAQLVSLLPLTPNGLGLREWVIAALAPAGGAAGAAAALVDRAVEVVAVVIAGAWGAWRLRKAGGQENPPSN